jgi:CRISPR-associated protein Cas1
LLKECRYRTASLDSIRGWEGEAARSYFSVFDHLITQQKADFRFVKRSRRPPMDSVNALLSFVYTLIAHDTSSALEAVGLDPQVGCLHRDRPGRPGLALDLMEELRTYLGDRLVLSLINRQQVKPKGFTVTESGAVNMDNETRKTVLSAYQERKREEIRHPFLNETLPIGLLPHVQALLLTRHLRGDLEAYPPFVIK